MTIHDLVSFIKRVNRLIECHQLSLPRISKLNDIGSVFFLHLFNALFKYKPKDVTQFPQGYEDEVKNMQIIIDELANSILSMHLNHIKGKDIIDQNLVSLHCLLEILEEFSRLKSTNSSSFTNDNESSSTDIMPSSTTTTIKSAESSEIHSSPLNSPDPQLSELGDQKPLTDSLPNVLNGKTVSISVSVNRFSSKEENSQIFTSDRIIDVSNVSTESGQENTDFTNKTESFVSEKNFQSIHSDDTDNSTPRLMWKDVLRKSSFKIADSQQTNKYIEQIEKDSRHKKNSSNVKLMYSLDERKNIKPLSKSKILIPQLRFDEQGNSAEDNWTKIASYLPFSSTENETSGSNHIIIKQKQVRFIPSAISEWKNFESDSSHASSTKKELGIKRKYTRVKPRKLLPEKTKTSPIKRKTKKVLLNKNQILSDHITDLVIRSFQEDTSSHSDVESKESSEGESDAENIPPLQNHNLKPFIGKHGNHFKIHPSWKERIVDAARIYGYHPRKCKLPHKKRTQKAEPKTSKTNQYITESDQTLLTYLQQQMPYLAVEPNVLERLEEQYRQQISSLFSLYGEALNLDEHPLNNAVLQNLQHQVILNDNFEKDVASVINKKNHELEQYRRRQIKNFFRDNRIHYAQMKRYYEDFQLRQRSKALREKTRDELLLKRLYDEGMTSLKDYFRTLYRTIKEQKLALASEKLKDLKHIQRTYSENLASLLEEFKTNYGQSEHQMKALSLDIKYAQNEFRNYLKTEIKSLQSQLIQQLEEGYHFTELDVERLTENFQKNIYI